MKAAATALAAIMAISTCMTAMAASRQETGYYTSERREGLKTYKSQKRFNWMTENNQIIFSTVCMNERSGSIEYRECRKRAKVYFKQRCNHPKDRFCHAENNYNPL